MKNIVSKYEGVNFQMNLQLKQRFNDPIDYP